MAKNPRLIVLVSALVVILLGVWVTDRPGPAEPRGRFASLVAFALFAVGVTALIAQAVRRPNDRTDTSAKRR